ncbi:MAG: signal peptide peptidase SppA [Candidatus Rokubacteria bacterium]|nr:signal peptide peptidase SppA [Candidatus Rokubacteria bacterium]MBI2198333.1 signal peptide peptidase SppA [Candidatus Rokubacteria bacterium]MBI3103998.1 signal peptide peptidase SppA [Candidatus Rokubacteria bacterium]
MRSSRLSGSVAALLAALVLSGCSVISLDLQPRIRPLVEETVEGSGAAKIVLMDLSGVLAEDNPGLSIGTPPPRVPLLARVREELRRADQDDRVRALIVRINSPGGTITASDILHHEISAFKARKKIPVVAVIMDVGASGGYYAALAADTIIAHPTAITGSIGVVMLTVNAQGLLEKIGVAPLAIKSGPRKDAGSPFRSLTDEERAIFQGVIDDMHGRFVRLIAASRKMPEERVRAAADGRIYTAEQARALGLVDRVGYLDDAVETARQAAGLSEARIVMYHRPREYRANFYSSTPAAPTAEAAVAHLAGLVGGAGPRFLYLWWP